MFSIFEKLINININIPFKWGRKNKTDYTVIVAQRFFQLFKDHGVAVSQIPRLVPDISFEKLRSPENLIPVLTDKIINRIADLFQIRREWLEGLGERIYNTHWCYKNPEALFQDIAKIKYDNAAKPIIVFCSQDKFDYQRSSKQPLVLVLCEKITNFGEKDIQRYKIYEDGWLWDYSKCRIQLKAMTRVWYEISGIPVPIYKVDHKILEAIRKGCRVPNINEVQTTWLHDVSLEDYALSPEESAVSKESEELPNVLNYIRSYNLENIAREGFKK